MDDCSVLIIGGGVSACACAATLASHGVPVLVMSSALDTLGQPSFGPDVAAPPVGWDGVREVLEALPRPLRDVWLASATASDEGWPFFAVDRRMLSVETKRALERMDGLQFRQGLAVDLRVRSEGEACGDHEGSAGAEGEGRRRLVVETAFGEALEADVVVLAVGLGLGGVVRVGDDALPGGRYGEGAASGLRDAVERLGVEWKEMRGEVGPRYAGRGRGGRDLGVEPVADRVSEEHGAGESREEVPDRGDVVGGLLRLGEGRPLAEVLGRCPRESSARKEVDLHGVADVASPSWPADYPAAPHWDESLRSRLFGWRDDGENAKDTGGGEGGGEGVRRLPRLAPDGAATGEVYFGSGVDGVEELTAGRVASRLGQEIAGLAVDGLGPRGRLRGNRGGGLSIWVVGRAGGACDYLESLASGVRAAEEIVESIRRGWRQVAENGRE